MPRLFLSAVLALGVSLLPVACQATEPTIVCFGDSLTAGYRAPSGMAYPDFLQKDLDDAGYHYHVIRMGQDGSSSTDALSRVPWAIRDHPAIVILEEGGVDGLRGTPVPVVRKNLSTMIQAFQNAHAKVLLVAMQTLPNLGPDYVNAFDALYPALAKQYHIPITRFMLQDVYFNNALMSGDGIHPNADGYRAVADRTIFPALKPMLHR